MKRFVIALAALLSLSIAVNAQQKTPAQAKKALNSAIEASNNEKKALKVATWIKLGECYVNAYKAVAGPGMLNAPKAMPLDGSEPAKPLSVENVTLQGQSYLVEVYETRKEYYVDGILYMIEITSHIDGDELAKAAEAYVKAHELDVKGSKNKAINEALREISGKYRVDALTNYSLGRYAESSRCFFAAATVANVEPANYVDTSSFFNAGVTANSVGDYEFATVAFEKCVEYGYGEKGDTYAHYANALTQLGKASEAVKVLELGFESYPGNQMIIIGLINSYISTGGSTDRLFELINTAKQNDPTNASICYVAGNIHKELADKAKENDDQAKVDAELQAAIDSYNEATALDPTYEYGLIGVGIIYNNISSDIAAKAEVEYNDAAYQKLIEEFNVNYKLAYKYFEQAFEVTKDTEIKLFLAEQLKSIAYRFSSDDPAFEAAYYKYDKIVKEGF